MDELMDGYMDRWIDVLFQIQIPISNKLNHNNENPTCMDV
jgi:hypothetical protein